jgi:hypothetical protein
VGSLYSAEKAPLFLLNMVDARVVAKNKIPLLPGIEPLSTIPFPVTWSNSHSFTLRAATCEVRNKRIYLPDYKQNLHAMAVLYKPTWLLKRKVRHPSAYTIYYGGLERSEWRW